MLGVVYSWIKNGEPERDHSVEVDLSNIIGDGDANERGVSDVGRNETSGGGPA